MSYGVTIEYLYGLQKYGMKFGLDNIRRLLAVLGNPETSFRTVHVAGTNGKGSTAAMIESIVRTGGVRTGLFTSPHLVSFTERIQIEGKEITEQDVIERAEEVKAAAEALEDFSPTFFEVVTAMALLHFRKSRVDWAVIEVGMGGRLDATNVIVPEASVITRIDFDHREFLGRTLREIAREKAGIIKEGVPVISAEQHPDAAEVIRNRAAETRSPLFVYNADFSSGAVSGEPDDMVFTYSGSSVYEGLKLPLAGEHQVVNASLAAKTAEVITEKNPGISIDIKKGLENVRWPGRLEFISSDPPILIDGGHNPAAAAMLSNYLRRVGRNKYRRIILVIGIMNDKDIDGILYPLLPLAEAVIFTAAAYGRAATPEALASHAASLGFSSHMSTGVSDALTLAKSMYCPGDLILVTGSFYTIGEAKEALVSKGVLARLRE